MNWRRVFSTGANNWSALIMRLTLGIVIFPHGAQKLLGWFGGYGFTGTMGFLTGTANLPWIIGFLVIMIEFIGSLALIAGFATRFSATAMLGNFMGIVMSSHMNNGFFMNWAALPNVHEGFEYHLLVLGLCISLMIVGGGKWSLDSSLSGKKVPQPDIRHKEPLVT